MAGKGPERIPDAAFFWLAFVVYAAVELGFLALLLHMGDAWTKYDTGRFYRMADVILKGGTPYVDFADPKPPLIFFTLAIPDLLGAKMAGGYALTAMFNLASALLAMKIAWRLYGRLPGLLAGLVFTLNLPFIEGFFTLTEPFTTAFILASAYVLLFWKRPGKYLTSGILTGIAIGFKQYALLAIPLSLILLFLKGELRGAIGFLAGLLLPLFAMFGAVSLVYGAAAGQAALYWSFSIAPDYILQDNVGGVSAWKPDKPVEFAANLVYTVIPLIAIIVYALAGFARGPRAKADWFLFLSCLAYGATILIRPYFHYLVMALPFMAILCASAFRNGAKGGQEPVVEPVVPAEAYGAAGGTVRFK